MSTPAVTWATVALCGVSHGLPYIGQALSLSQPCAVHSSHPWDLALFLGPSPPGCAFRSRRGPAASAFFRAQLPCDRVVEVVDYAVEGDKKSYPMRSLAPDDPRAARLLQLIEQSVVCAKCTALRLSVHH